MPDVEPTKPDPVPLSARAWDEAAPSFDESADHGLRDPDVRAAWTSLLSRALPAPPSRVADLGCGTGSLAMVAAELGHDVDGVDFSERMLTLARAKAGGRTGVRFELGDVADPPLAHGSYDAVICRHRRILSSAVVRLSWPADGRSRSRRLPVTWVSLSRGCVVGWPRPTSTTATGKG